MTHDTSKPIPKAVLVGIPLPEVSDDENQESLIELGRLVKTLGFEVVASMSQRRQSLAGGTVLGEGKLKELANLTGGTGVIERKPLKKTRAAAKRADDEPEAPQDESEKVADVIIFDCELSPSQLVNLQKATSADVLDRTGVIVEIFSRHAKTREARLQVEMARLKYLAPRIRRTGKGLEDRMGKAGESSMELDRRKIRDRIAELREELAAVQKEQSSGRAQRAEHDCVALVGYTNAGKSSLMRALTGSQVMVADKLFATLDTTVRTLAPPTIPQILVTDTVGFIKKLPHDLVASFRSTLEEARNAGLLLYVVDAADPSFRAQLQVAREVLASIVTPSPAEEIPSRLILNKCDKLSVTEVEALRQEFPEALALSAKDPADVAGLRDRLVEFFEQDMTDQEILLPYSAHKAVGALRAQFRVLSERHGEEGTFLRLRASSSELTRARVKLGL